MSICYSVLVIKPMMVGRGEASEVLEYLLHECGGQATLRLYREWSICTTTLHALCEQTADTPSTWCFTKDHSFAKRGAKSWCLLFTGSTPHLNPHTYLKHALDKWMTQRHRPPSVAADLYLIPDSRVDYEATLLFQNFDAELL